MPVLPGLLDGFGVARRVRRWLTPKRAETTVFHVTHHKAGSQWINRIFHALAFDRLVQPAPDNPQFLARPIRPGAVYPTLYITREQFESVKLPRNWRRFVVIRDLRDSLISAYFSFKHSHPEMLNRPEVLSTVLHEMNLEEGLLYMIERRLIGMAQVQWSWRAAGEELIKYEDLLKNDEAILERVLLRHCRLPVSRARLLEVIRANRFEARSGRPRGTEDIKSHERKGVAGDWRNYFTPKVTKEFKARYGSILVATGYERDFRW
jgi:hypothetical protein